QNDRFLAKDIRQVPVKDKTVFKRQKPASVMVWAGVTTCGRKTPLIFIPEG
ncbi:Putative LOC100197594, partial [Caligus rogercresseyi]